ncbi:hypothetical protein MNBD_GAMMA26-877 [hydrothermal vent metagenome]|uniref:DUF4878 domain-containing protein n=1 Tax=hydrothermal vent metagenome TaxID=652676 RepID=A0A3B1BGP6_9ZZZZ
MCDRLNRDIHKEVLFVLVIIFYSLLVGCSRDASTPPEEGPEVVVDRFYSYISEAKRKGGGSPASAAFKMISSKRSQLVEGQFLEVIRGYPAGFTVTVGKATVTGTQALVDISYKLPSMFDDDYTVNETVALTIDQATNTWLVDFTNETHGMEIAEAKKIEANELARMK